MTTPTLTFTAPPDQAVPAALAVPDQRAVRAALAVPDQRAVPGARTAPAPVVAAFGRAAGHPTAAPPAAGDPAAALPATGHAAAGGPAARPGRRPALPVLSFRAASPEVKEEPVHPVTKPPVPVLRFLADLSRDRSAGREGIARSRADSDSSPFSSGWS